MGGSFIDNVFSVSLYYPINAQPATELYISGLTNSADVPLKFEFQSTLVAANDFLIAAYFINGTRIFTSYFGGDSFEGPIRVEVVSAQRRLAFCANTNSSLLATQGRNSTNLTQDFLVGSFDISKSSSGTSDKEEIKKQLKRIRLYIWETRRELKKCMGVPLTHMDGLMYLGQPMGETIH